jgi:hypothetical protein
MLATSVRSTRFKGKVRILGTTHRLQKYQLYAVFIELTIINSYSTIPQLFMEKRERKQSQ